MRGNIFVISAPSGTGKTTVLKKLLGVVKDLDLAVSYTTRKPRATETNNVDYKFVSGDEFKHLVDRGALLEWAEVHGHYYGTPKADVLGSLDKGRDVLLDIDTQGAEKVRARYTDAILIFLLPPSFDELERRLQGRGADDQEEVRRRIDNAGEELSRRHEYNYQVVNDNLDEAVGEIAEIIDYYRGL